MTPNDNDILTQAVSEIARAKKLMDSAGARLRNVLNSGSPKSNSEVEDITSAITNIKDGLTELGKIKIQ
jgi:hypothetical protein